jgi:outer membrane receptor protein involved in Fe transport
MEGYMPVVAVFLLLFGSVQTVPPSLPPLRGVVRDQTGAVLQGARVELADEAGAVLRTVSTDARGEFSIDGLPPGAYVLKVQFEGFRASAIRLRVAPRRAPPPQTIVLDLASQTQEVTVTADTDLITAAANANRDAVVLDEKELKNLPIFDRDIVGTLSRFLDASALGTGGVTLVVDGMEARKVGVAPSAILQVKLNQDPYSAELPRPGRGRIEVITKAGTDKYSGSMDFTFRDASLNARDPFADTRPPEQRRIYEGVIGGPVRDGKHTSFLFTLDRKEEDLQSVVFAAGPDGPLHAIVPAPDRGLELAASVNHQQGKRHTLSLRFTDEQTRSRNQGVGGTTLAEAGSDDLGHEAQLVFGARSVLTGHLLNEFRLLLGHETGSTASLHTGQRIVVLDAFTAGGAQADQSTTEDHFNLAESLTYVHGKHLLKAGFAVPDFSRRGFDDRSNRDGTFTFASLADYALGRPLSFVQQRGDGHLVFLQQVYGAFVQDQINVSDRFSITPGVRYDWQNIFTDNNNVAPRLSAAYAFDKTTAIRGGFGVFYDRAGDGPIREVLRSREERLVRVILLDPSYPDPFVTGTADSPVRSVVTLAPGVSIPYTFQFGVGLERVVRKGTTVAVNYLGSRGVDLFRSHDVNAPLAPLYAARPNPAFGQIRQIESTARQAAHSLQVIARGHLAPRLQGSVQYTLATAHNDTSGINALPANNYDLAAEYGRADFDQRHRLEALLNLKAGDWADFGVGVSLGSGRPYSLRTGTDDFHTGQTNARPAGIGRNTLQGPGFAGLDVRWSREFAIGSPKKGEDGAAFTIGIDAFNVVNRVNYSGFVGNQSSPFFGQAIAAQPPRRVQLSAGFHF